MSSRSKSKKVLLMGRSGSGKSSMRSVIFSNYKALETRMLGPTIDVEHSNLKFLNELSLNLWDCGGQDIFVQDYLSNEQTFKNAEVLIYVFDVESREINKDIATFRRVLEKLSELAPNVYIFCLVHKMDLIDQYRKEEVFNAMNVRVKEATKDFNLKLISFPSSIYDESIFKAWSKVVSTLVPNAEEIKRKVKKLMTAFDAKEITLLEQSTALVLASTSEEDANYIGGGPPKHQQNNPEVDGDNRDQLPWKTTRHGMFSAIIKSHKHLCTSLKTDFATLTVSGPQTTVFISGLTPNISILIITANKGENEGVFTDSESLLETNLEIARKGFEGL